MSDLARHPERFGRSYLCSGVTAVFDVGGYAWTLGLPAWSEASTEVPHVAAAGPLLSTIDHWLNLPAERQFMVLTDPDAARAERALSGRARLGRRQGLVHRGQGASGREVRPRRPRRRRGGAGQQSSR